MTHAVLLPRSNLVPYSPLVGQYATKNRYKIEHNGILSKNVGLLVVNGVRDDTNLVRPVISSENEEIKTSLQNSRYTPFFI